MYGSFPIRYDCNRQGKLPYTTHATPSHFCSLISRKCINDIMQYLCELKSNISSPIRLQWFDFEENIDADKWSKIAMNKMK